MPIKEREELMGALLLDPAVRRQFAKGNGPRQDLLRRFGLDDRETEVLMGVPSSADNQTIAATLLEHFGESD